MKKKSVLKIVFIIFILIIIVNLNPKIENQASIVEVEENIFTILAKRLEDILINIINLIFSIIKKLLNLFFSI